MSNYTTIPPVEAKIEVDQGWIFSGYAEIGSNGSSNELRVVIKLPSIKVTDPSNAIIQLQPRDTSFISEPYPDAFATRIIGVNTDQKTITVSIRRVDTSIGWELRLRLDIIVSQLVKTN